MLNSRPPELSAWGCLPKNFMTSDDQRYGKVSIAMCKDKRITNADRTIYAYIKAHINWRVVQTQVAAELDIGISTVQRSINRLDAAGYLNYDTKASDKATVRTNIVMRDQPEHLFKNEHSEMNRSEKAIEQAPVQKWVPPCSNMNTTLFKNEQVGHSNMNSYVASNVASLTAASLTAATELDSARAELERKIAHMKACGMDIEE